MLHGGDPPPPAVQQWKRGWSKRGRAVNIKHTDFRYSVPKKKDETSKNVYIGSIHSERLKDDSLGMLSKTHVCFDSFLMRLLEHFDSSMARIRTSHCL